MTFHDPSDALTATPSDDRLIDYLLAESFDHGAIVSQMSDAAVERWLAADEANVRRLESLAMSVLAVAVPQTGGAVPSGEASSAEVAPACGDAAASAVAVVPARRLGIRAAAVGLLALAATLALAVFWSRPQAADELSTQRIAQAWAESFSTATSRGLSAGGEMTAADGELDDEWPADWEVVESDDWLHADESESFAAGNDSPPQWLLTALAQMSSVPEFESGEAEEIP